MSNIKLHKYFFDVNEYDITEERKGNTQRSRTGKIYTDYTSNAFKTFDITVNNLTEKEHYNLLYITSLVFPETGNGAELDFISPFGNSYTVTIPINGYNFNPQDNEENLWSWELTLEEVI